MLIRSVCESQIYRAETDVQCELIGSVIERKRRNAVRHRVLHVVCGQTGAKLNRGIKSGVDDISTVTGVEDNGRSAIGPNDVVTGSSDHNRSIVRTDRVIAGATIDEAIGIS